MKNQKFEKQFTMSTPDSEIKAEIAGQFGQEVTNEMWQYLGGLENVLREVRDAEDRDYEDRLIEDMVGQLQKGRDAFGGSYVRTAPRDPALFRQIIHISYPEWKTAKAIASAIRRRAMRHPGVEELHRAFNGPTPPSGEALLNLRRIAEELSQRFLWKVEEAVRFVLDAEAPDEPPPVVAWVEVEKGIDRNRARIEFSIDPSVSKKTVERAYHQLQKRLNRGLDNRPVEQHTVYLFEFVEYHRFQSGGILNLAQAHRDWKAKVGEHHQVLPAYAHYSNFHDAYNNATERLLCRDYQEQGGKRVRFEPMMREPFGAEVLAKQRESTAESPKDEPT